MKNSTEKIIALAILAAVLAVHAAVLAPELTISRVDLNDNGLHFGLIDGMAQAIERGDNPFDWWAPEWSMGYPVLRTYQPLAHAMVVAIYFALFKSVSLMTIFVWVRYLSVLLLPLTFFLTARLLTFSWLTSAAAAMLAPLISTEALYGLEYGSYLWAGSGLFTQAIASHFALMTIGFGFNAIRRAKSLAFTGVMLGLTFLAHFIYGYIAAITLCLLSLLPDRGTPRRGRILRTAWIGAVAFAVSAFELLPLVTDGAIINHSRWEPVWKWESFGAGRVMKLLFTGELLDHNRVPIFTLLALAGAIVYFRQSRPPVWPWMQFPARTFVIASAVFWILVFFGRPFWGPALLLIGVSPDMQLHRVIGGAHIFLVLLAAIGLAAIWRALSTRVHAAAAVAVTAILFYPMLRERNVYLTNNSNWGHRSLEAYNAARRSIDTATEIAKTRGGRAYAGLPATWGGQFKIGDPQFYAYLSMAHVPALSFMYHSMSLTSETMTRLNEFSPVHFRLFDLRTVITPSDGRVPVAPFLTPLVTTGPLKVYAAPDSSAFDVVDVFYSVQVSKNNFYDVNDRWQQSNWAGNRQHLLLDLYDDAPPNIARLSADDPLPGSAAFPYPGVVVAERHDGDNHFVTIDAARSAYVLYKTTWHPNWRAAVDGSPVRTVMLSPGFIGVPVPAGRHNLQFRYQPETWKAVLAILGPLIGIALIFAERRAMFPEPARVREFAIPQAVRVPALLFLLALPVMVSLVSSKLPEGHDATEYLPRMVEFHENIRGGILFPRWAPDLSRGAGQPLFLYNPPMFYYLAEFWHLLGFDFVRSMNLACIVIVLASGAGMFLLGKLYFGERGGWLAAAAYLYAPYFAVNLYVRTAWAEFAAFPFFAFALFAFGAYAKTGARKYLAAGAAAYAGILASHNAAALLFTPVLLGFIALTAWMARSWFILRAQALAFALGLALAAFIWIPGVAMNQLVHLETLMQGRSQYTNHFVFLHQLIDSPWGYGFSLPGDADGMSFSLGWGHLVIAAAAAILILKSPKERDRAWVWYFAGAAAILSMMMLQDVEPVWDHVRLLQFIAFPWRLLGPAAVALAALIAAFAAGLPSLEKWSRPAFIAAMALLIVPNLAHFQPGHYRDIDQQFWSPQQIAERGIEVTSFSEYRPKAMETIPPFNPRPGVVVSGLGAIQQTGKSPESWSGVVTAQSPVTVQLSLAWFPAWNVLVDGKPVVSRPAENIGLIRFDVPPGEHRVFVRWGRTRAMWIGDIASLLALCVLVAAAVPSRKPEPAPKQSFEPAPVPK